VASKVVHIAKAFLAMFITPSRGTLTRFLNFNDQVDCSSQDTDRDGRPINETIQRKTPNKSEQSPVKVWTKVFMPLMLRL
jgi:hypothetical protein